MTASNPCCPKCDGWKMFGHKDPCANTSCPCHRPIHVSSGGSREKSGCGINHCDHPKCFDIPTASNPYCECKEPLLDSDCGFHPFCHRCGTPIKNIPAAVEKPLPFSLSVLLRDQAEQPAKEKLASWPHKIPMADMTLVEEPEKEWWEEEVDKKFEYAAWMSFEPVAPDIKKFIHRVAARIAAQSEKKGRESAVDYIEREGEEIKQENDPAGLSAWGISISYHDLDAARSSDEGKTNNK